MWKNHYHIEGIMINDLISNIYFIIFIFILKIIILFIKHKTKLYIHYDENCFNDFHLI